MGDGRNPTKRAPHVPVGEAHNRITENVRRADAGFRLQGADDIDQITRPADGHSYFYDATSGLHKTMLAPPFLKFNYQSSAGALTVAASDEDPVASAGKLILVNARLTTAGSSTTTAVLKHNSSNVTTFTFASSSNTATWTTFTNTTFAADDYFWVDITAAGTGAAGLVIVAWATAA